MALWLATGSCSTEERPAPPPAAAVAVLAGEPTALPELGAATQLLSGTEPQAVVLHGGYAYVADVDGLSVYAVDTGGRLELKHHVPTPGKARDLALSGSTLYVADGRRGLASFALDPPDRPRLLGEIAFPGVARRVVASEQSVGVLHEGGAVTLLRAGRAPEHLVLPGEPMDAAWVGPHLYVADTGDGLVRVELEPGPPRVAFRERAFRRAISLAAAGSLLLLGSSDKRVVLMDVSQPLPRVLAEVALDHKPMRLDLLGTQVLAAGGDRQGAGATSLQFSEVGTLEVNARLPFAVLGARSVGSSLVLAARGVEGLELLRTAPELDVRARVPGLRLDRVAAGGDEVVIWGEDGPGAWIWSLNANARPAELAVQVREAIVCGGALCTLDSKGNLCQRPLPVQLPAPPVCTLVPEGARSLAWQSGTGTLWVLDEAGGLQGFAFAEGFRRVTAVSRPPTVTQEKLERLTVDGERAVAIDPLLGLLQVFDVVPTPRRRGFYLLQSLPTAVALAGGVALVAEPSAGLQVVDVTDPDKPHELSFIPLEHGPQGVAVWWRGGLPGGARVALAQSEGGVSLWAWDGRGALRLLRRSDTSGLASDVAFAGGSLWLADRTGAVRYVLSEERP